MNTAENGPGGFREKEVAKAVAENQDEGWKWAQPAWKKNGQSIKVHEAKQRL